ncbi:uDP-N-acetylglucosamine 1-carboxyvinyltransferase [Firmicutes bacterium CAG:631]|jgi:UDP-N-acetylglucosamine 1-carboxyvinyltransferase|nr:uDP-N-acetylglucosamine 1-carboxyvinyltransferase [Firmicutes bacterium CAG:631]
MKYRIEGNQKLEGKIFINGSKNAALAILVGAILSKNQVILHNTPNISDVRDLIEILKYIHCKVNYDGFTLMIDSSSIQYEDLRIDAIKKLRASYYFMGAFLSLFKKVQIYKPGGCNIGERPIDIHLNGFEKMNVQLLEKDKEVYLHTNHLKGNQIKLSFPSVGATINLVLAAIKAKGTTILRNVATEPEIIDFVQFLKSMGAKIDGEGTKTIIVHHTDELHGCTYTIMPDRIEAGTYLIYGAAIAKKLCICNIIPRQVRSLISIFVEMGIKMDIRENEITIYDSFPLRPVRVVTGPFPSFPTDLQQILCPLLLKAEGESYIIDTIYHKRSSHIEQLKKMNANVKVVDNCMFISKSDQLISSSVECNDLRGGAGMLLACLMTPGVSILNHTEFIERGYQNVIECLTQVGAKIEREEKI